MWFGETSGHRAKPVSEPRFLELRIWLRAAPYVTKMSCEVSPILHSGINPRARMEVEAR